jgi:hypothetical protein
VASTGCCGKVGREVTEILQPASTNVQTIKHNLNFIQNVSFRNIVTIKSRESSKTNLLSGEQLERKKLSKIFNNRRFALTHADA